MSDPTHPQDPEQGLPPQAQPPQDAPVAPESREVPPPQPAAQQPVAPQPAAPQGAPAADPAANPYATPAGDAYGSTAPAAPLTAAEDKQWAAWAHFGGAVSILAFFSGWLALLAILPALIIFLVFGKRGALTREQAKEALNFQITMVGAMIVWAIVGAIVGAIVFASVYTTGSAVGLGILLFILAIVGWALVIIDVVFSIIAGVRVNAGGTYRYPFALRLVK